MHAGSTTTEPLARDRVQGPRNDGEKICHIVYDDDPDTALCGKDVTGWPWSPPWPMCVVCVDLHEQFVRRLHHGR